MSEWQREWLVGFSGDVFVNLDPGIFKVWDSSKHLRREFPFNLPLEFLKCVAYDLKNDVLATRLILQALCDEAALRVFVSSLSSKMTPWNFKT
jgi:hypothetical protein